MEDFGMHYKCTEYYKMKRYITSKLNINDSNQRNDVTKTIVNEIYSFNEKSITVFFILITFFPVFSFGQVEVFSGKDVDESKNSLPGVTVRVEEQLWEL
jgi:hypothetical protein